MLIPIRTVAITPYAIDAQLSRLPRLVQRLTFIYSRTFSIPIANLQYYIYIVLYVHVHICCQLSCQMDFSNWRRRLSIVAHFIDGDSAAASISKYFSWPVYTTYPHTRRYTYVCANFSVRFVISCSLSGGRSVPIATLFVRARADLQAPLRGRCTWASRCCCRHCRCCGCIGKPDQAPCTYRGNGPGCWLLFCHKLQTSFATRLFW